MLRIVPTVSRFASSGLLGKVAASTHTPRNSRRTFASTSARGVGVTLTVDEKEVTVPQGSALIQASEAAGATISSDRLDEAESAYWLARQHELMDMTRGLGSPHLFFTLSGPQWTFLYKHMPEIRDLTKDQSLHLFFKHFLIPLLGVVHFWYRYEWQEGECQEGVGVRGFLWLKDAPNIDEINWELLKDEDSTIPEDQEQKMRRFVDYWDPIITASSLFFRQDVGDHPSCKPREKLKSTKEELADLLNWVRRHTAYGLSGEKMAGVLCRFEHPKTVHAEARVGFDSMERVQSEPRHSGRLLDSYASIMRLAKFDAKPIMSEEALRGYVTGYATKAEIHSLASSEILQVRGEWEHSAQESSHVLRQIPHVRCSVSFETLNLGYEGYREPRLQEPDEGDEMEGVDAQEGDILLLQRYMKRPLDMEELSIYDVMTKYTWMKSEWRERERENTTRVVLRVYPRFSPNPEDDQYNEYCRTKIILHHPFRNLATLLEHEDQSWAELYARCRTANHEHPKDTLRCWEEESRERPTEELGIPDTEDALSQLIHSKAPEDIIGQRPVDDEWDLEASHARWEHIDQMSKWIHLKKKETFHRKDDFLNVNIDTLTQEQRKVLDVFTWTYTKILAGESPPQFLLNIDGTAGSGKTYLIRAICQELRRMARENDQRDPIRVVAPTGAAASNISGRTIQLAFSLCIINKFNRFTTLPKRHLAKYQLLWEGVHFVIFDDKSMIGASVLARVDWRSRQIFPQGADKPFSNLNIALVGDFAQLPPVDDSPLYAMPSDTASDSVRHGSILYSLFKESYCLQTVHRQSGNSPEQIQFRDLLRHACEGNLSKDEWRTLITRSENKLSPAVKAQFEDAMYLFATRSEVEEANLRHLVALNQPCARIMNGHDGGSAAEPYVVLARGAKVMLSENIWQELGLVNTTMGVVEDIIWAPDSTRSELPIAVLVSFPTYTGPTLWYTEPREGFPKGIPILPIVPATFEIDGQTMSCTQLPLRLAWATTLNEAQGLTLSEIKLGLGEKDFSTGLIYFALSRVKTLDSVMFVDHFDLARVNDLEGSQFRDRLEDFARRYPPPESLAGWQDLV